MNKSKPLLLLLDGNALVHRAFHALPPLTVSRTGEMVNAVYGFAATLLKVLSELKPTHWVIAFDRPGPTFRHEKFKEYKIQRPPVPKELISQLRRVHQLAEAFPIPVVEVDGYEADDVLATLSWQASQKGIDSVIVTGDTDVLQIVSPKVKVLAPRRTFSDTLLYDEAAIQQRFGLNPKQLPDLKALIGDPSDNIPGIPGIGEKTATRLLKQFGSLEGIYSHIAEVVPTKLQDLLRQYEAQAFQSKELVISVLDVPVSLDLDTCQVSTYNRNQVVELFRELEFVKLLPRLPQTVAGKSLITPGKALPQGDYQTIQSSQALQELVAQLSKVSELVVDVETSTKETIRAEIVGIALSPSPGKAAYIPVGHYGLSQPAQLSISQVINQLKPLLENPKIAKIAHNGKYDMTILAEYGVCLSNLSFDTMIAAYLLGEKSLGLKALAFNRLGIEMTPISDLIGSGPKQISMAIVEVEQAANYACADADVTRRLKDVLKRELKQEGLWQLFNEIEMPLVPVLVAMERNGVAINVELLREMSWNLGQKLLGLEAAIYNSIGYKFNINSSQQLARVLYEELKLPRSRRTKSGYSTEASVLEGLKGLHPVIELILEYRQLAKLKSTYIDALPALINPKTGRVHTNFNQTGTATGRLSSSEPNLQNIPIRGELGKKIRQAFVAPPGYYLLAADYSQIDLRVLAHLSQDEALITAFLNDEDIHTATASRVFNIPPSQVTPEMRRVAKTVNFGVIYGMSDYGLEQATDLTREEASQFINSYFEKYPKVKEYIETTKQKAREQGYVQTVMGRRRFIPEINSPNRQLREAAERMAINMPVQGTSADIIKIAMINLYKAIKEKGLKSKMILQVHDELLFEVPEAEVMEMKELVAKIMPQALKLTIPLKVDIKIGKNWGETE